MAASDKNPIINLFKVNLLIQKDKQTRLYSRFIKWLLSSGRFIVILVEILVVAALITRYKLDSDLSDLQDKITQQMQFIKSMQNDEMLIKQTQFQLATIKKVRQENQRFPNAVSTIAQLTPKNIRLNNITFDQSQTENQVAVTVSGQTPSVNELSALIKALQKNPSFVNVILTNMTTEGQIVFTITGNLVSGGDS